MWYRIQSLGKVVPRTLGFPILTHAFEFLRHPFGKGFHEPTKTAIDGDRSVALLRAVVQLIPVSAALSVIILNWNTYYVGATAYTQATYQLIAKVHELTIQASLAAVIFSCIRSELVLGKGIPFGLLSSGLQTTQVSYLWSMEFWGSLRSGVNKSYRRITVLLLIPTCILLASVCGPSSVVLLVPRSQFWPGGSTNIWVNATNHELWPTKTDASSISEECLEITADQTVDSTFCPSSQWQKIRDYLSLGKQIIPNTYKNEYDIAMMPDVIELDDRTSQRQLIPGALASGYSGIQPIVATTQHAAVADAITTVGVLWDLSLTNVTAAKGHGSPLSQQTAAKHSISKNYKQPYSSIVCIPDSITSAQDTTALLIPQLPGANALTNSNVTYKGCGHQFEAPTIAHPSMTRGQILNLSRSTREYTLHWIELEPGLFEGSSIAAIVVLPNARANDHQDVRICNIGAGWGTSSISTQTTNGGTTVVTSRIIGDGGHPSVKTDTNVSIPNVKNFYHEEMGIVDFNLRYNYPQQIINITQDWARYLNPTIADLNTTVVNALLQEQLFSCSPTKSIEIALAALVANGLAQSGAGAQLQGTVRTDGDGGLDGNYWISGKGNVFSFRKNQTLNWTRFHVDSTIEGYAYNTAGLGPRVAIVFLIIYCVVAIGHVFYTALTGTSSNSWDSISELTALAMNSTPTAALRNTCAGITEFHIFQLPVRVLVRNDVEGEGEHLELVFNEIGPEKAGEATVKPNRAYGTMPRIEDSKTTG